MSPFKITVIGGGISSTTFLRSLTDAIGSEKLSINLLEKGDIQLVDHISNFNIDYRPEIVKRYSDRP